MIGLLLDIKVRFLTSTLDVDVGTAVGLLGTETLCLLWTRTRVSSWKACTLTTCILFNNSSRHKQHDNDIIIVGLLMTPSVRRRRRRRCSDDDATEADANADAKSRMMDIIICCNLTRQNRTADVASSSD